MTRGAPLRVAFLVDSLRIGGSELAALRAATALTDKVTLEVFHLQREGPLLPAYQRLGISVHALHWPGARSPRALHVLWRFVRHLERGQFDLLHSHDYFSNIIGAICTSWACNVRLITSKRWIDQYVRPMHRTFDEWAYRKSSLVLANSATVARTVEAAGLTPERVRLLPNFVADELIGRTVRVRKRERMVVGMVSRLAKVKNHELAFAAFPRVLARFPDTELHVYGDGEMRATLQRVAREQGIEAQVHFKGEVDPGTPVYGDFDVFLLSSVSEGSPNAVLEAMAHGVPVVATSIGGVPDLVAHESTGLLVESGDAESMAEALCRLLGSEDTRRNLATMALGTAREYAESRVVGMLLEQYAAVAERRPAQGKP